MSNLSQSAPTVAATEYRPVSGLALAGFGLAALLAVALFVGAVVAFRSGAPLILHPALLLLPAIAASLCAAAWLQMVRSQGAQAGLKLAKLGLLITFLAVGAYLPWRIGKELAVQREAEAFTDAWLAHVQRSGTQPLDSYVAYWQVLDPDRRDARRPLDHPDYQQKLRDDPKRFAELQEYLKVRYAYGAAEKRITLPRFLAHELVQLIARAGDQCQIKARGMQSWDYSTAGLGGYLVEMNYDLTTPEGTFPAVATALGSHIADQPGRQWQVLLAETSLGPPGEWQLTPLGRNILALRGDSREFARDWVKKLTTGQLDEAYLDTRNPRERAQLRGLARQSPILGIGSLATHDRLGPPLADLLFTLDGRAASPCALFGQDFQTGALLHDTGLLADPSLIPVLVSSLKSLFQPDSRQPAPLLGIVLSSSRLTSPWLKVTEPPDEPRLVFLQPFSARVPPNLIVEGAVRVGSADPGLWQVVEGAGNTELQLPLGMRPLRWQILGIDLQAGRIRADDE